MCAIGKLTEIKKVYMFTYIQIKVFAAQWCSMYASLHWIMDCWYTMR